VERILELPEDLRRRLDQRLEPYARALVERSAELALELHADEVGAEHLLCVLMRDADCAAHRAVLHAFADPQTLGEEALALAAGILISGSAVSLPFSEGSVRSLARARALAAQRGEAQVLPLHLLSAALSALPADLCRELEEAGCEPQGLGQGRPSTPPPGEAAAPIRGSLFANFSEAAKKVLSAAARLARQEHIRSIGPAHLALACLLDEPELGRACRLTAARARMLFRGRSEDPTPLALRALPADEAFLGFLAGLAEGTTSLGLLARFHAAGPPELARLLAHHRLAPPLLERAAAAFGDPQA